MSKMWIGSMDEERVPWSWGKALDVQGVPLSDNQDIQAGERHGGRAIPALYYHH